jgi:chromosomal replication initiation ATPase DnaA
MSDTATALATFRAAFNTMLEAADGLRAALEADAGGNGSIAPDVAIIQRVVAEHYGYSPRALCGRDRHEPVVTARHVAMWFCRSLTRHSLQAIAANFGGRDHGTVIGAVKNIGARISMDPRFAAVIGQLRLQIEAKLPPLP